jgi:hypothetical protein
VIRRLQEFNNIRGEAVARWCRRFGGWLRYFTPNLRQYLGFPERGPYKADCSATHTLKTLNPLISCVLEPKVGFASFPLACLSAPRYPQIQSWFMLSITEPISLLRGLFPGKCPEDTKHKIYLDTVPNPPCIAWSPHSYSAEHEVWGGGVWGS